MKVIKITVNGEQKEVAVDERESLADTLRNRLGLTSVKKGCEVGECGACTVLVDGKSIDSCIYLALWANEKSIMTVEGVTQPDGELTSVQRAFIEEAAVQCGFCTPGLIMTAVELVGTGKKYTREELRRLISGHLCRCTGYQNILNAVEKVAGIAYQVVEKQIPTSLTKRFD
jgi:Aerobic-type carbon monoxide dehydrogenase, small subunit CoxS/CutS homologs